MKNIIKYILVISLIGLWTFSQADEKITNQSKVKVKPGTHWIEKGNVQIHENGQLIIEGMLTVDENILNTGEYEGLQIISNASNTGSIIYQSGTPYAKVERYMKSARSHFIGSPVIGETADALDFNFPNTYLYTFTDGSGISLINNNSTNLVNGQGYYYRINPTNEGGITPEFNGTLKATDLVLSSNSNPPLVHNSRGQNMLANPFSSAIDWDHEDLEFSNMEASVWVYDANTRRVKFRNNAGYGNLKDGIIPMGQGFMVRTYSEEATLTIPANARLHHQQQFYKASDDINSELNYLVFNLIKDTLFDEIWVGYQWNSTDDFDNGLDISKMFTFEEEPQIYTSANNEDFSINLIETPGIESKQVPVFIRAGSDGLHQLDLMKFQGFSDVQVELEDLVSGAFIDVESMESYEFVANVSDDDLRFILHFNPLTPTGLEGYEQQSNHVQIYSYGEQIYIKSEGDYSNQKKNIFLYDLNGKLLTEIPLSEGYLSSIKNEFKRKMIVVKAKYQTDSFTEKVLFIK